MLHEISPESGFCFFFKKHHYKYFVYGIKFVEVGSNWYKMGVNWLNNILELESSRDPSPLILASPLVYSIVDKSLPTVKMSTDRQTVNQLDFNI